MHPARSKNNRRYAKTPTIVAGQSEKRYAEQERYCRNDYRTKRRSSLRIVFPNVVQREQTKEWQYGDSKEVCQEVRQVLNGQRVAAVDIIEMATQFDLGADRKNGWAVAPSPIHVVPCLQCEWNPRHLLPSQSASNVHDLSASKFSLWYSRQVMLARSPENYQQEQQGQPSLIFAKCTISITFFLAIALTI